MREEMTSETEEQEEFTAAELFVEANKRPDGEMGFLGRETEEVLESPYWKNAVFRKEVQRYHERVRVNAIVIQNLTVALQEASELQESLMLDYALAVDALLIK